MQFVKISMSEGDLGRKKKILITSIVITIIVCASVVVWWQMSWRCGNSLLDAPTIYITINITNDSGNCSVHTIREIDYGDFLVFNGTFSLHNMTYSWGWGEINAIHGKLIDIVNNFSSPIIYIDSDHDGEMSIGDVIMLDRDSPQIEGPFGLWVFSPGGVGYHVNTEIIGYE